MTCVLVAAGFAAAFSTTTVDVQPGRGTRSRLGARRLGARTLSAATERVNVDDLRQSAIVMATFAYQAANLDRKLPR